jgi:cytochrome P450
MARVLKARERINAYLAEQIPVRRARGGDDLFSLLCRATEENRRISSVT